MPEGRAGPRRLLPDRRLAPLLVALMAGLLLSELDQSMVAAALPSMVDELDGVDNLMWVNTAYLLAATGVLPLYGALGDRFGRRPVILVALGLIMIGSVVGALAASMSALIMARVTQGLGAGGMLVLVQAAVADVLPVRDRAPVMSLIGAVFGAAAIGGPLLGGWLAEGPGWRWTFWINLPVGGLALIAGWWLLPGRPDGAPIRRWRAVDLLPVGLFRTRAFALVALAGLVLGAALFGVVGYLPTYLQLGLGLGPVTAGLWMLTLAGGLAIGTVISAQVVARTGVHRPFPIVGAGIAAGALGGLALLGAEPDLAWVGIGLALLGLGIGCAWEVLVIMVQNAVDGSRVGAATAMNGFTREIGVLVGSAYAGGMITTRLSGGGSAGTAFSPVFAALAAVAVAGGLVLLAVPRCALSTARPPAARELVDR
ncbi:MAG TPA: MFS transporter [Microlunatus sp.]